MRPLFCDACGTTVYFENDQCLNCGHALAYLPDEGCMAAITPAEAAVANNTFQRAVTDHERRPNQRYRHCLHAGPTGLGCNWLIPAEDDNPLCQSCRLTTHLPDLTDPVARERVARLEAGKRRMLVDLDALGLPVFPPPAERPLQFAFLADQPGQPRILTGHDCGLITINIKEADDVARTRARESMGEPYRTVLGHLRHEIGHYFWDVFFLDNDAAAENCRALFGDDRADYGQALQRHYSTPNPNWAEQHISQYASAHPWEDWAETWAHALHLHGLLDSASGLAPALVEGNTEEALTLKDIDAWIDEALRLTPIVNELNRSLGQDDAYPFALNPAVREKLRFVLSSIRDYTQPVQQGATVLAFVSDDRTRQEEWPLSAWA